jgi:hypothetical protein
MGKSEKTENIGKYWSQKYSYDEKFIIDWVQALKKDNFITPFNNIIYNEQNKFISLVNRKLNPISRKLFNFYFRKIILNNNKCNHCGCEITKDFILTLDRSLCNLPNWCETHYKEKIWSNIKGSKYSIENNISRSLKRKKWLETEEGKIYKKKIGENNKISTTKWKQNQTDEERKTTNKKSSESQIKNILEGKFNPQKNYHKYNSNLCYIDGKVYNFRSSWEVVFFISNNKLKYETLKIPYYKNERQKGIYIPDFIDDINKIIYELKPRRNFVKQQIKMDAGIEWSNNNGYKFIWVNENNLINYINQNDNKDERNAQFYIKVYKGIDGHIKNQINKENRNNS